MTNTDDLISQHTGWAYNIEKDPTVEPRWHLAVDEPVAHSSRQRLYLAEVVALALQERDAEIERLRADLAQCQTRFDCLEHWPNAYAGDYDPNCCRFPKSCSIPERPPDR